MLKNAMAVMASLVLAMTVIATSFESAEARSGRHGAFVGGVALGALTLGAMSAYGRPYYRRSCSAGPRECSWVGGRCYINRFGEEICRGGHRECWRPTYCD